MSPYEATVDQVTLTWIKSQIANVVTPEFAEGVTANVFRDQVWGGMTHQLVASVLAEKLPPERVAEQKTFTFSVPASPWQQFKSSHAESWWLRWLVRRRPAAMVTHGFVGELTVDLDRYWAYPEARVARGMGTPVRVAMFNQTAAWETREAQR